MTVSADQDDLRDRQRAARFAAHDARPGPTRRAGQAQVPGVTAERPRLDAKDRCSFADRERTERPG